MGGTGVLGGDAVGRRRRLQSCPLVFWLELLSFCPWLTDLEALRWGLGSLCFWHVKPLERRFLQPVTKIEALAISIHSLMATGSVKSIFLELLGLHGLYKLACSARVVSWLLSFMRHGGVVGVSVAEVPCSPWPSLMGPEAGVDVGVVGPSVLAEVSPSPMTPSIWWKFHKPTLRIQYEQVRMGRLMVCIAGLGGGERWRDPELRHLIGWRSVAKFKFPY